MSFTQSEGWRLYVSTEAGTQPPIFYGRRVFRNVAEIVVSEELSPQVAAANRSGGRGNGRIGIQGVQRVPDVLIPFSDLYNDHPFSAADREAYITACRAAQSIAEGRSEGTAVLKYYAPRNFNYADLKGYHTAESYAHYPYIVKAVELPDRGGILIVQPKEIAEKWWTMSLSYMQELPNRPNMIPEYEAQLGRRLTTAQLLIVDEICKAGESAKDNMPSLAAAVRTSSGISAASDDAGRAPGDAGRPRGRPLG